MSVATIELDETALTGGAWVTINGAHVYIKDGVVTEGAASLRGKKGSEAHDAAAAKRERAA